MPNSSTASAITSWGQVVELGPIRSWSQPTASNLRRASMHSSGVPTRLTLASMRLSISARVGSGRISGHGGMPFGRGNVSRYRNSRLLW